MEKPFAITPGRRLEPGQQDRFLARRAPGLRRPPAAVQPRLPGGENIQQWLYHAEAGDYEPAWRELMEDNPFPAVMGRVCYHPCETACNRGQLDEAVGINSVERFLGDEAIRRAGKLTAESAPTGKRVLVVGAGPSGLSAAYHLARLGHDVTIREAGPTAGGMMRFGIPALPPAARCARRRDPAHPRPRRHARVGREGRRTSSTRCATAASTQRSSRSARTSPSAHTFRPAKPRTCSTPWRCSRRMEGEERPLLGRRVVVYGGGNTAMDAARTAKRLGANEAIIVYRRTRERMPAHDFEVEEALEEGVMMKWLSTIKHADDGKLVLEKMELDETGFPRPTGETEELEADSLVLALGQEADLSLLDGVPGLQIEDGVVVVDARMMTGHEGIFAGGDMVPAERTVTVGVGHGKQAARNIDAWLRGSAFVHAATPELASFDLLNVWYYADAPKTVAPQLDVIRRQSNFDEVTQGLDETNALFEARRCLSCGNCFGCDNCYGVCPDNAVLKVDEADGYAFDLDYCKGCGICVAECPCGAIEMVAETI